VERRAHHHLVWELPLLKPLRQLAFRRSSEYRG
jgi:hypothetical protein